MNLTVPFIKTEKSPVGTVYFVTKGEHCGRFMLFLEHEKEKAQYKVLALPECDPIFINESEFGKYVFGKYLEKVEKVPKHVLKESILEFNLRNSQVKR